MSLNIPDAETTVSRAHRLLHHLKLLATTLAALVGLATTFGLL
ncbi:hypothetical protein ACFQGE_09285 [Halomicroarcula sp. GCM10025817]|nr:hypothetical protein [Halomicroarcula sp. SYNS111]